MVQIDKHLKATAKPSERHSAGYSTATASHQPVQAVSAIVFEKEFFDELITTNQPQVESSVHSMDEYHTDNSDSTLESIPDAEAISHKNSSDGPRYSFSTEIPETYDDFYLCVLPRDPKMLYVYWELPDGTRSEEHTFQEHAPTKEQLVLRVNGHAVDKNVTHVNSSYDIPLQSNAADSYIHVPTGASQCSVECGIVNEWGNFRPYTPPDYKYNQSIEMVDLHNGEKFEYHRQPLENGIQTAPVSVGTSFMEPVTEAYCSVDNNNSNDVLVRRVDLPVVKLDTTHYRGSATPV